MGDWSLCGRLLPSLASLSLHSKIEIVFLHQLRCVRNWLVKGADCVPYDNLRKRISSQDLLTGGFARREMETENIQVELRDGVQTIRFSRAEKKNAITTSMYRAMTDALQRGDESEDVRVHLFVGSGGCFTAGNDIGDFLQAGNSDAFASAAFGFLEALVRVRKPMVAAVDGDAIGIGTTMLFHMDLVYASEDARFVTPFVDLGLVPEGGSSLLMPLVMGHQRAFEMLCLGEAYDSKRAFEAGFVTQVVSSMELEQTALQNAMRLAAKPAEALQAARALLRGNPDTLIVRIHEEGRLFMERLMSAEASAAFQSFLGKG